MSSLSDERLYCLLCDGRLTARQAGPALVSLTCERCDWKGSLKLENSLKEADAESEQLRAQLYCPKCNGGLAAQRSGRTIVTLTCTSCGWQGASLWFKNFPKEKSAGDEQLEALSCAVDRLESKQRELRAMFSDWQQRVVQQLDELAESICAEPKQSSGGRTS